MPVLLSPRRWILLTFGTALALTGCGAYDTARGPEAGPALSLERVMDSALSRIKADPVLMQVALTRAGPETPDAAARLRDTLRAVQSATGRADPSALHEASQNIRRDFILASGAQMILPDMDRWMQRHSPASLPDTPSVQTLSGFHTILKESRAQLESHLGDRLRSPLQPLSTAIPAPVPALEDLELLALSRRAELRMEIGTDYDPAQLRADTLRTLPGVARILSAPRDDETWNRFADAYAQSLIRVFTLPLQMSDDATRQAMTRLRHHALTGAVLAQVHLAHRHYSMALARHQTALDILDKIQDSSPIDDSDWLNAQAALVITTAHLHAAQADLALAAGLIQGSGRGSTRPDLFLQDASLQSGDDVMMHKAGLGLLASLPAIPFVQKLSGRDGAGSNAALKPVAESSFLPMPDNKLQTLLNAPISDP